MVTKRNPEILKVMYKTILCIYKGELPHTRGIDSMEMWDSVPVNIFIVPVLHIQIFLGVDVLRNHIGFIDSDMDKLSTGEEMIHNTLVIVNQVIAKSRQDLQI